MSHNPWTTVQSKGKRVFAKPSPPKPTPRQSNLPPPAQQGKQLHPSLQRANFDEGRVVTTIEKTRCQPSLIAPEYLCDKDIPINDTDTLAEVCFELHEKVKTLGSASPLGVSARLELKFVSPSLLRAKMLIDPVVWYDEVLNDYPDRVKVARQYVTEARRMQTNVHSYIDPTTHPTSVVPAQYCQYGVSCTHFSDPHRCKNKHSNRALQWANATRRDGYLTRCGWYVMDELLILEDWIQSQPRNDDLRNFIITCRPERSRELLIFPRPTAGKLTQDEFDIAHLRNMEVIRRVNTWKAIAKVVKQLEDKTGIAQPVELIALNFGAWETQLSKDPWADDSHAHIHVVLTKEAAIAAGKVPEMAPFKGRIADPISYLTKDCNQLELHRLMAGEIGTFRGEVGTLRDDMGAMRDDMGAMRDDMGAMRDDMGAMRDDMGAMRDDMGAMRDDMGAMRDDMGALRDEMRTLREEFSTRFTRLETILAVSEDRLTSLETTITSMRTTMAAILERLPAPATQAPGQ